MSVFGSVLAFGAYLTLIGRIGAGRAGYVMVAIPVVALAISTVVTVQSGPNDHIGRLLSSAGRRKAELLEPMLR